MGESHLGVSVAKRQPYSQQLSCHLTPSPTQLTHGGWWVHPVSFILRQRSANSSLVHTPRVSFFMRQLALGRGGASLLDQGIGRAKIAALMRKLSRALVIYWLAVGLLAGGLLWTYKVWNNKGMTEKKMKAAIAEGRKFPWNYYVKVYGPKAVLLNSGLCVFLLAAGPWGLRRLRAMPQVKSEESGKGITLAVVALTMVASAVWAAPRMTQGLWTDEATSMAKFMVGEYEFDKEGKWGLDPVEPDYRQFSMTTPNNHMLYSTMASLTHQALARKPVGPQDTYFTEWVLRLPAFLAGLAALASLAWLAGELGFRRAGWMAVLLLALHPWHLHYMTMARGYSMILALIPAFLAASIRAVRTGRWRWWLVSTLCQVAMIDTWPLAADVVILGNLVVFGMLLTSAWQGADRWTQIGRWAIVSVLGAMATVQLLLPALPQIAAYMEVQAHFNFEATRYVWDPLWGLFTGATWRSFDPTNPYAYYWQKLWTEHPVAVVGYAALLLGLFAAGWWRMWSHSMPARWMAVLVVLIPVAITLHLVKQQFIFLTWYSVPAVPGVMLLMAVGFVALFERWRWCWTVAAPVCLGIIGVAVWPLHWLDRTVPHGRNKEAALLTRSILNPTYPGYHDEAITASLSMYYKGYDCLPVRLEKIGDLDTLIAQTEQEKRELYVSMTREVLVQGDGEVILAKLGDPAIFEALPPLYGTDPEATMRVFRYKGGGVASDNKRP